MVFFAVPFGICVFLSLTENTGSGVFVGFANYKDILASAAFRLAAWNTFRFNAAAVPLIMVFSFCVALMLHQKLKGYEFFRAIFIFPLVLPAASVVLFFQMVFGGSGMLNGLLEKFGLPAADWFGSGASFPVLVALYVFKNCGYNIILFLSALNSVPKEYSEAACLDGANRMARMTKITLPLIFPYSFFILVISIINSFRSFREAYMLFGNYPDGGVYMLQHFMNNNFGSLNYTRLACGAIIIFAMIFVFVSVLLRLGSRNGDIEL
ncbi:MAG: sugar ABC transporter permease [Oscillospiraceae bacterium]|nr:sugar ABC transporter permease [Oscillospiraceae bacterium]